MSVTLSPLPYALNALEPHISRRTLSAHHGHHAAYIQKTRALAERSKLERLPVEELVRKCDRRDSALFNASAQAWNHEFFWRSMCPGGGGEARGAVAHLIEECFGSQRAFCQEFLATACDLFGSGWVWLLLDRGHLKVSATSNAGTPLVTSAVPLLTLDVWEHSYYLDYQHRRLDYVTAFLAHLVNWSFANERLAACSGP